MKLFVSFWMVLLGATLSVSAQSIIFSEIHYNPSASVQYPDGDVFEFLELKNISDTEIDISGYNIVGGINFVASEGAVIPAGGYYVIARSGSMFFARYETTPNADFSTSADKLSNKGERIVLRDSNNDTLINLKYDDEGSWPFLADGYGFSLEIIDEEGDPTDSKNWRNSTELNGSPWEAGTESLINAVYISEIIANSESPSVDSIEFYNPNTSDVDISGWGLTDGISSPFKFIFPENTIVPAQGYLVIAEGEVLSNDVVVATNPTDFGGSFGLSSMGDDIYLYSASQGELTGFVDGFDFGPSQAGNSISRLTNTSGKIFYLETPTTIGKENIYPSSTTLVFEEILYAPVEGQFEYLKIKNISDQTINIDYWDISGVGFEKDSLFADIEANESFYVIEDTITPEQFRTVLNIDDTVQIFTYSGSLRNEGEEIAILKPGDSVITATDTTVPYYAVETVRYNDKAPWPIEAASGKTLSRKDLFAFAYEPSNWVTYSIETLVAKIVAETEIEPNQNLVISGEESTSLDGKALSFEWWLKSPNGDYELLDETNSIITVTPDSVGVYWVKLIVSDGMSISFPKEFSFTVDNQTSIYSDTEQVSPMVYPTYTSNDLTINTQGGEFDTFKIVTLDGSPLVEGNVTDSKITIALNSFNLAEGYLIVLLSKEDRVYATKIYYTYN